MHPNWCDPACCTTVDAWPYGHHQSASQVVTADPPVNIVAELHLTSTLPGLSPQTLLMLELDTHQPDNYQPPLPLSLPLTLDQAHTLYCALGRLLGTVDA